MFVMDNAKFHYAEAVRELIDSYNHQIKFLPAYSPFFNPIERLLSLRKNFVKSFALESEADLFDAIDMVRTLVLGPITPA